MLFVALYIVVHVYGVGLCCFVVGLCCLVACIVWICYLFHSIVSDAFYATSGRTLGNARELVACRGSSASKALPEDANVPSYTVPYNYSNGRAAVLICGKKLKTTLQDIHARGSGHNDVKAANVFIPETDEQIMQPLPSCEYVIHRACIHKTCS